MDKRINLELRGRQPSKLKELDLSGCKTTGEIEGLNEEFTSLEVLDFSNANITSLKTFPKLPNLLKLDFSGNRLSKGLEYLKECTNLKYLNISSNRIKELEPLEPLKSLAHLTHLELGLDNWENSKDQQELRQSIFELLPNLQYLDQTDIDGNEEDDDEGIMNGKGLDDVSDGDDELEDEEGEEDDDDDEDSDDEDEDGANLSALYDNGDVLEDEEEEDEDYNEDASEDDEEEDEVSEPEPEQSTRGKKRKLDDRAV